MEATIKDLKDSFKVGYEAFETSRKETNEIRELYHNRQFTADQLAVLGNRGQPAESFNVIKMFARMLIGYYSTVVNTVVANPVNPRDLPRANMLNDVISHVFEDNRFDIESDTIKLNGLLSGLLCAYTTVVPTGETDEFNRPINQVITHHVPDSEIVLDPMSTLDDYSDAGYLHRFKWITGDTLEKTWGKEIREKLDAYQNFLNIDEADYEFNYGDTYTGYYRVFDNYLVVHSVIEDNSGKRWSIFWSGDEILEKKEITLRQVKWPYRVAKLHSSDTTEHYGIFREVRESQHAINQAIIKIQQAVNTSKAFVEDGAVEDMDEFTNSFNRVNAVIKVTNLSGIRVENLSREVQDQYVIVDRALDRIQRVLGINDSFMGLAFASDSGRKVKLQQNATIMSLRYITARIEAFYRSLGSDIASLISQFYNANQILSVSDELTGRRWLEINQPITEPVGLGPQGEVIEQPILLPEYDPDNNDPILDEEGNIILAPVNEPDSDLANLNFNITIESSSFNDEDERGQLLIETIMSGQIGQMTAQVNPAGFFKMASLSIRSTKTKYTPDIAEVLNQTAEMLAGNPAAQAGAQQQLGANQPSNPVQSRTLSLPQNTNEEAV